MKREKQSVYFEDSDNVNVIHDYFSELSKYEKQCAEMLYGTDSVKTTLKDLKKAIEKWSFLSLSHSEHEILKELVSKEFSALNIAKNEIIEKRFHAFFALTDYLCRHSEKWKHYTDSEYDRANARYKTAYFLFLKGEFGEDFNSIQRIFKQEAYERNPLAFYYVCQSRDDQDLPCFDFAEGFDSVIDVVRNYGMNHDSAIEKEVFEQYLADYEQMTMNMKKIKFKK